MKKLQFKCMLLSDVIINQKAATEGNQQTLDFIPGSAFLGIAAGAIYKDKSRESMLLFHSGKVRFGDAHPFFDGKRAVRIPASWYYRKGDLNKSALFVHHGLPEEGLNENGKPIQIKQCRDGFMLKEGEGSVSEVEINKNFAIKSAYDSATRRSEDKKMYGYESLEAGSTWCFEVAMDHDAEQYSNNLIDALKGKKQIGRSSTAQYGLIDIEPCIFESRFITEKPIQVKVKDHEVQTVLLYAESRLIFIDQFGQSTFTPTEQQLGLKTGKIDWAKSQIRTFQYAPYNNHRKNRDADRCGIEKGSVFCVMDAAFTDIDSEKISKGIGSFLNEGFGKVLVNPEFLAYNKDNKGEATFTFDNEKTVVNPQILNQKSNSLPLDISILNYLKKQKALNDTLLVIYKEVNNYVDHENQNFRGDTFASQWGTIRSIAMKAKTINELKDKLYNKPDGYLVHGVAKDKWTERNRLEDFQGFISKFEKENPKANPIEAVINLAAEMAKKCKKEDQR